MGTGNKRLRDLTWGDYGIDESRYRELKYFCLQYRSKKREAAQVGEYGLSGISYDGNGGGGSVSDPTMTAAINNVMKQEKILKDVRIIEEAAMWAADVSGYRKAWRMLLRSVTEDIGYERITLLYTYVPYSKTDFYGVRRAFFHRLDQLQTNPETRENKGKTGK